MARYRRLIIMCIAMSMGSFTNGFQALKSENPIVRNEPRIMTRNPAPVTSRETFMQKILSRIQGPSTSAPLPTTPRPVQPQVLQPLGYNHYQQPTPHFVYRYPPPPPPYFRYENSESVNSKVNDSVAEEASSHITTTTTTTTVAPPVSTSTEKPVIPPRFHRGRQLESDTTISIPILRSDIPNIQEWDRKVEQKQSQVPKCYVTQKSLIPLPPIPLPLYNNFGYGFPFGYQHLQPNAFPGGPYGNPLFPVSPYTRYPIIYFSLPKKKPADKEPFDLIAMEENKVVSRPVAAPTRPTPTHKPQIEIEDPSSSVEATSESTQKETLESFSSLPLPPLKPTPTAESSMEEIVEIDVDPVSKLLDMLTGTSHELTGEEKQEKDLVNLPTQLRPIETDVVQPKEDIKSYLLKTVDDSETTGVADSTPALPRQRTRKYNLKHF